MGLLEGFPLNRHMTHSIELQPGFGSMSVRPYMYPYHHKDEIGKQVHWILKQDIIRHCSSAFSSPVILVKKKDNTWRMCVDYRQLNKVTILDKHLIPVVEDLLDELHKTRYFSKIDLKSGYHQIRVRGEDIHTTMFRTHEGIYEFLVMSFRRIKRSATQELKLMGFLGIIVV